MKSTYKHTLPDQCATECPPGSERWTGTRLLFLLVPNRERVADPGSWKCRVLIQLVLPMLENVEASSTSKLHCGLEFRRCPMSKGS